MEDLLLAAELDTACPPSVGQMLEQLRHEVAELRGEVTRFGGRTLPNVTRALELQGGTVAPNAARPFRPR